MSGMAIAVSITAAVLVFWAMGAHHRLVLLRNAVGTAFAQVDVQLTRRYAIVERLSQLAGADGVAATTQGLDTLHAACQQARAALELARRHPGSPGPTASLGLAEQILDASLERMLALGQTSDALRAVLSELNTASAQSGFAQQQFNAAVAAHNLAVLQVPTNLLSKIFRFDRATGLPEAASTEPLAHRAP